MPQLRVEMPCAECCCLCCSLLTLVPDVPPAAGVVLLVCAQATRDTLTRDYQAWLQSAQLADVSEKGCGMGGGG